VSIELVVALIVFLFPLAYSPGPGNSYFAAIGAAGGLRSAVPALVGYHIATVIVTFTIGMGVGLALLTHPTVAFWMKLGGAIYVFWIGISFVQAAFAKPASAGAEIANQSSTWVDGAVLLILNPKAYLIIGLLFTQFLTQDHNEILHVAAVTMVFTLNNIVAFVVWTLIGAAIGRFLKTSTNQRNINLVFAFCLFGVAIWMMVP
jgi:threonine/homoserine/homoserine lactone efflux protein